METSVTIILLGFLVILGLSIFYLDDLFASIMLFSFYSLISATLLVVMDAVDVAFTEAAVGAGISTVLMLATLALTRDKLKTSRLRPLLLPLLVVVLTGATLIYGTLDLPHYGNPDAPVHKHVAPRYIHQSPAEVGPPNMVTSVLASYRGYDTLGEVTVIFCAGLGVMILLGNASRRKRRENS